MHIHLWCDIPIFLGLRNVGSSVIDQKNECLEQGHLKNTDICIVYHSKLCRCAAYATHMMVFVAFASMQYFALLMSLIFYFILVLCRVIASPSCLHHSLMFVLFCFALLCLPLSSSSSFFCILSGLPVPGACCVFSCACPSPSRSEHWGAHSDPSGGETSEDQSPAQAGGGQRYGSRLNRMCLGKGLCGVFLFA